VRSRRRTLVLAFAAALVAFLFALPFLKAQRCAKAGGQFDRTTLACTLP
jgi:cytochrome oxidase Cu insertion factor (SCO1/SenC/PrrC family)